MTNEAREADCGAMSSEQPKFILEELSFENSMSEWERSLGYGGGGLAGGGATGTPADGGPLQLRERLQLIEQNGELQLHMLEDCLKGLDKLVRMNLNLTSVIGGNGGDGTPRSPKQTSRKRPPSPSNRSPDASRGVHSHASVASKKSSAVGLRKSRTAPSVEPSGPFAALKTALANPRNTWTALTPGAAARHSMATSSSPLHSTNASLIGSLPAADELRPSTFTNSCVSGATSSSSRPISATTTQSQGRVTSLTGSMALTLAEERARLMRRFRARSRSHTMQNVPSANAGLGAVPGNRTLLAKAAGSPGAGDFEFSVFWDVPAPDMQEEATNGTTGSGSRNNSKASPGVMTVESSASARVEDIWKRVSSVLARGSTRSMRRQDVSEVVQKAHQRRPIAKRIWRFLEDSASSTCAWIWSKFMIVLILAAVSISWTEVLSPGSRTTATASFAVQAFLLVELFVRLLTCPNQAHFLCNVYNIFDFITFSLAAATFVADLSQREEDLGSNSGGLLSMRIFFPTLLLLKLLRRFRTFHLLISAFENALEALPVLLYTLLVITMWCAACLYLIEPRDSIASMGEAMWCVCISLFSVGFQDMKTVTGSLLVAGIFVCGVLYMAIPIGIVGSAFNKVWEDRERLLLLHHMRDHISWAGYTAEDIRNMFSALDVDGDNTLTLHEFKALLPLMEIDISDHLVQGIFQAFDGDGEGSIDFNEFLLGVYPAHRFVRKFASSDHGDD